MGLQKWLHKAFRGKGIQADDFSSLCDKNLPWQHDRKSITMMVSKLINATLATGLFSGESRTQDKTISLSTNTIKSPALPCYDKSPTDLKLKNSSSIRTEFTMPSQHGSALKWGLPGVIHIYSIYSKANGIPYSIIHCFPKNLSGIVLEKGSQKKVASIVEWVPCSQLPVNLTHLQ